MDDLDTSPYLAIVADKIDTTVAPSDPFAQSVAATCTSILRRLAHRPEAVSRSLKAAAPAYRQILGTDAAIDSDPAVLHDKIAELVHDAKTVQDASAIDELQLAVLRAEHLRTTELLKQTEPPRSGNPHPDQGLDDDQRRRLQSWLRSTLGHPVSLGAVREIAGGFSKRTLFVDLEGHPELPCVVLRIERDFNILGTSLADEFPFVDHVNKAGVLAPQAVAFGADTDVLGHQFAVYSLMPGKQIGDIDGTTHGSERLAISLAHVIAHLHSVPLNGLAAASASLPPAERMRRELDAFETRWQADGSPTLTLAIAFNWLRRNLHLAEGDPVIVHRDIGWHNMLVQDDEVSALLDWEMSTIGVPAQDLGYVYLTASALTDWDKFLDAYTARRELNAPPAIKQINFFRVWREVWRCSNVRHAKRQIELDGDNEFRLSAGVVIKLDGLERRLQELLIEVLATPSAATNSE